VEPGLPPAGAEAVVPVTDLTDERALRRLAELLDRDRSFDPPLTHTGGEFYQRLAAAIGGDLGALSPQAQRILVWLCEWDDATVAGLVEILETAKAHHRRQGGGPMTTTIPDGVRVAEANGSSTYTTRDGDTTLTVYFDAEGTLTLDVQGRNCGTEPDDEPDQVFVSLQPGEEDALAAMFAIARERRP
jgi:hypothetical protein